MLRKRIVHLTDAGASETSIPVWEPIIVGLDIAPARISSGLE